MQYDPPGRFKTLEEFRARLAEIDPSFCADDEVRVGGPLAQPLPLFGKTLGNRFACHPMEGWDGDDEGRPTDLTLRRWRRFGESGAALVWGGEAYAVRRDGRANPHQLCMETDSDPARSLAQLLGALREGSAARGDAPDSQVVGLQLTHSGRFARPDGPLAPRTAFRHALLERKYPHEAGPALLSDAELEGIAEQFVAAARFAWEAGFHFVDLKACHGYLMHELLSARSRSGPYGGSLAHRARLLLQLVAAVRSECPGLGVGVRLSLTDSLPYERDEATGVGRPMALRGPYRDGFGIHAEFPHGFDPSEPVELLRMLHQAGVEAINLTLGSPYWNPHLQRPAAYPPSDGYSPPADPLAMVFRHLDAARRAKAAVPELIYVGTGYTYLQEWLGPVAQHEVGAGHVDLIGLGRMLLSYPDLPRDLLAGQTADRRRLCRTFSDCTTGPRNGMVSGCFPLDPFYRERPEAARVKALRPESRT
ncbi:MAG: NADH:flavin oxidoreductase [Planctomycetota bacterium]|nr:NADH:flavin oxidoreductase [Planctomycetota bacterium]